MMRYFVKWLFLLKKERSGVSKKKRSGMFLTFIILKFSKSKTLRTIFV